MFPTERRLEDFEKSEEQLASARKDSMSYQLVSEEQTAEIGKLKTQAQTLEAELTNMKAAATAQSEALATANKEKEELSSLTESQISGLKAKVAELEAQVVQEREEAARLAANSSGAEVLQTKVAELTSELTLARTLSGELEVAVESHSSRAHQHQSELLKAEAKIKDLQDEVVVKQLKIDTLTTELAAASEKEEDEEDTADTAGPNLKISSTHCTQDRCQQRQFNASSGSCNSHSFRWQI